MSIKIGSAAYEFDANQKAVIECSDKVTVFEVDENGEPNRFIVSGRNRVQFRTKTPFSAFIAVSDGEYWSLQVSDLPVPHETPDPRPFEIPEELKKDLTLEDKLKAFVAEMVAERYGQDSDEMDTLEEALDLDMDDEDDHVPLSGFEVQEMEDVELPPPVSKEPVKPEEAPEEPQPPPEQA